MYYIIVLDSSSYKISSYKIKVLAGLHFFWRFWKKVCFLVFPSSQSPAASLGSCPFLFNPDFPQCISFSNSDLHASDQHALTSSLFWLHWIAWIIWMLSFLKILKVIASAKSSLPCKGSKEGHPLQVPRIRTWTFLEGHYSVYHRMLLLSQFSSLKLLTATEPSFVRTMNIFVFDWSVSNHPTSQ